MKFKDKKKIEMMLTLRQKSNFSKNLQFFLNFFPFKEIKTQNFAKCKNALL